MSFSNKNSLNNATHHWIFESNNNSIIFKDNMVNPNPKNIPDSCCIKISVDVKPMKIGNKIDYWYFDVSYSHTTVGVRGIDMHPLTQIVNDTYREDYDETLYEGIMLAANPITFHMLQLLLSNEDNYKNFSTGSRPFVDYQGEVMRALTEFEN